MRKRKQNISILIIPDDYSDPLSFKIKLKTAKILGVISIILIIHIFVGAIYYYKYAVTNRYRKQLEIQNINLKEENKQVHSLYDQVDEMLQFVTRFRSVLGVDKSFEISDGKRSDVLEQLKRNVNVASRTGIDVGVYNVESSGNESQLDFFLTRTKSDYHSFANNIPTLLPVEGFLSTDYRTDDWLLPDHVGIDIASNRGTNVNAAADGVIIFANWTDDLGNLIIIDHLNGFMSFYGHNQLLLKKEKTFVKKGETIALLGNSGRSTAPHLHFEVWKDGKPVDPKKYLLYFQNK